MRPAPRPWAIPLMLSLAFAGPPPRDEVQREAARLTARIDATRGLAVAVDVLRLDALGEHLPVGDIERRLRRVAEDQRHAPLVRAVADFAALSRAYDALDIEAVHAAARRLGLIGAVQMRLGPARLGPLDPAGFRPYPEPLDGALRLDAYLRPSTWTQATVATRLHSDATRWAVLRLGADDAARVILNDELVYADERSHGAWLDQAAIPIKLRAGDNLIQVEISQEEGAWRLLMRVTDAAGAPLAGVTAHDDPWIAPPTPPALSPRPEDEEIAWIWGALEAAVQGDDAPARALRDYADYARRAHLPDRALLAPRVAVEGAEVHEPGARSRLALARLLSEDERASLESAPLWGPLPEADTWDALQLALDQGWRHYYARRHGEALAVVARILAEAPGFLPVYRLEAVIYEDLNLPHHAAARLAAARQRWPGRPALWRAWIGALRASGRSHALLTALRDRPALRGLDDTLALVHIEALRGEVDSALAGLDRVYAARPDLWGVGLEAAELEIATGRVAAATARLRRLLARTPGEPRLIAPLARLHIEAGALDEARRRLREAATQDEALTALQARLDEAPRRALGPPLEALLAAPSLEAPEGVEILYKHVELDLDEDKRADRRAREVVRVLSEVGAARFNEWRLSYVPGAQALEIEEARLIRDGAPPASPTRTDVGLSEPEFRLYYDLRAEILTFKPRPGDVIEVAWRLRDVAPDPAFPDLFGELLYLQGEAPQREVVVGFGPGARAQLRIDATLRGLTDLDPGPGVRLKGVPAAPYEPKAPGPTSARAYLSVSTRGLTWAALDRRYQALLEGRLSPNAALQAKALAWVGDAQGDAARLARLYEEVAHRTRYVGLEFGVRSFQPAYPAETLSRGYGDCKDKATLLIALARSLNIPAQIVLLRTRGLGQLDDPAPSFALFDHAIVYAPSLGRYLDPTVDRNDPWVLPKADQGGLALIIGAASPPQIVPIQPPEANQLRWALDLDVGVDGVARGALRLAARGLPATQLRRRLEGEARPERALEALIGERWASAALQAVQLSGITPARDPLTVSARLTLPLPRHLGRLSLRDERRLAPRLAPTATRRTPLVLDYPWIEALDITLRPPPGGRIIAAPASPPGAPFGALQISHEERRVTQTLRLDAATISVADYPAFRRWLAAVDAAALVVEVQP